MSSAAMSLILRLVRALSCFQASEPILDSWGAIAFLADVFGNLVQRVDADVQDVVVFVIQAHGFLQLAADLDLLQSRSICRCRGRCASRNRRAESSRM
jgi:hypothetical protein